MRTTPQSRRAFLRAASGLGTAVGFGPSLGLGLGLAGLGTLASQSAQAAGGSGYKALVCLFMAGGNDSHNWIVPTDAAEYAAYAKARQDLAIPHASLMPMSTPEQGSGRSFGMPADLQPLHALYERGRCAVVANVGPLARPISKAEYNAGVGLPKKLFSHNDQQSTWQSLAPEGAPSGWGGRMADVLMAANQHAVFTAVSTAGNVAFLNGAQVAQYQLASRGAVEVESLQRSSIHGSGEAAMHVRIALGAANASSPFLAEYMRVTQRSLDAANTLRGALAASPVAGLPATTLRASNQAAFSLASDPLANQLRTVAGMIAAAPRLGMRRQVFMVQMPGFDTHSQQMRDQPALMARVAASLGWFMDALAQAGLQDQVTVFTASDFGRTLVSNGNGSDHGWGAHHLVVGGAVRGRRIAGQMPAAGLGTAQDIGSGRLLPSTSVTQLAAALGGWMGLSGSELRYALPNLAQFDLGTPALF